MWYIILYNVITMYYHWDHTNPPHPHHHPFNKFRLKFIKCNNSLNACKTELSSLQFRSFKFIKSDVWGWGGFVWPLYYVASRAGRAPRRLPGAITSNSNSNNTSNNNTTNNNNSNSDSNSNSSSNKFVAITIMIVVLMMIVIPSCVNTYIHIYIYIYTHTLCI